MKIFFIYFLIVIYVFSMQIEDDPTFKLIYQQKQNSDKIVLMLYSAKTCPQCAYMKEKVFKDEEVKKFMDTHFVILEKDINKDDLPNKFEYFGIPTMFFIDKNGKQIAKIIGSSRAKSFLEQLKQVVNR